MRQISVREMEKILKENGYEKVRTRGSHTVWKSGDRRITLPVVTLKSVVANRLIKENQLVV